MKKVLILFGGESTEHEVSCLSAASVLRNIDRELFEVSAVGITKDGDWYVADGLSDVDEIENGKWTEKVKKGCGMAPGLPSVYAADVVFPVMHGIMAEDGTMQGLLTLLKKPFVGAGVMSSAVCMDKAYTKIVLAAAGIPQVKSVVVNRKKIKETIPEIEKKIGYPCFVKPSNSGSSVGAYKVLNRGELTESLEKAAQFDRKILVEQYVNCKEVECAVLGNEEPVASTPGEIVSTSEFYDYEDKYINGTSYTRIPADIPAEDLETIRKLAVKAYKAADIAGLARVDFFRDKDTGKIYLNEINTLPGFTNISMYGKMWAHDGVDFKTLVTKLILLAEENFENNKRNFSIK